MQRWLAFFTFLVSLVVLSGCAKLTMAIKGRFSSGEKEMQSAFQVKQSARSWRMKTRLAIHDGRFMETEFEVSCPDRERITTKVGNDKREMVRFGKRFYISQGGVWYWLDVNDTNWSPCGSNSGAPSPWAMLNEGRDMVTVFASTKDKFTFSRGPIAEVARTPCQEWQVEFANAAPTMGHSLSYRVCISPDHLPVRVVMGEGGLVTEYSDWNQPILIEAPPDAVPYREPAGDTPELKRQHPGF